MKRKKLWMGLLIFILIIIIGAFLIIKSYWGLTDVEDVKLDPNVKWYDDYYTIEYIDEKTIAIGEPRYYQQNINYLILGDEHAILFDTGPGVRNIKPVVDSLTSLPIILMSSHFHYDHVGNHEEFNTDSRLSSSQLVNQDLSKDNILIPSKESFSFLGRLEGFEAPKIKVKEILEEGATIDLGNRKLELISMPGHAESSIMLYDKAANQVFTGDFIYKGSLLATFLSGTDLEDYLVSTNKLLQQINSETKLYGAHTIDFNLPTLTQKDLTDLQKVLEKIESGTFPKKMKINENLDILY
ncbi:MBL fold metallo-hydrolase [Lysinibacillus sp. NPDC096418]|uniref:MBL fold metallo-hydrolase n=1 Tax=Lysinibacillus sp. NPDC096418 TaxID=3364138 RepID=UPI00382CEB67